MGLFHLIPEAAAVVVSKCVYRQVKVYHRGGRIYVSHGSGFVFVQRVCAALKTSLPDVRVDEIELPFEQEFDQLGRLVLPKNYKEEK